MSILIHGLEMPMSCDICPMMVEADDYCVCYPNNKFIPWRWASESGVEQVHDKPDWCPLVPVPPHGDLIDLNAPFEAQYYDEMTEEWLEKTVTVEDVLYGCMVSEMPPVTIPADLAEEGEG